MKKIFSTLYLVVLVGVFSNAATWDVTTPAQLKSFCTSAASGDVANIANSITLTEKLPAINVSVSINGPQNGATISGANIFNIFEINIPASGTVTIQNLNLINGKGSGYAGGISVFGDGTGTLILYNVSISNCINSLNELAYGGAISTTTNLVLTNCTLSGNTAEDGGGAIADMGLCDGISISLVNCTIAGNHTTTVSAGGAFDIYSNISLLIKNSILYNNRDGASALLTAALINPANLVSGGYNVVDENLSQMSQSTDLKEQTEDQIGITELLTHGTDHLTHMIHYNSVARALIPPDDSYNGCPATDQRGLNRSVTVNRCAGTVENINPMLSGTTVESVVWNGATLKASVSPFFHNITGIKFEIGTESLSYTRTYDANSTSLSGNTTTELFATPTDLDPNVTYFVRITGTWDYSSDFSLYGEESSFLTGYHEISSVSFPGNYSWNNPATWDGATVPDPNCNVTIQPGVHVAYDNTKISFRCNNLTLEPGAMLTNLASFTIYGDLLIKSNTDRSGSLINKGFMNAFGSQTIQLYIAQNDRYYYVSVPMDGIEASIFGDIANTDFVYIRNTETSSWERITNGAEVLSVGKGYAIKLSGAPTTLNLTGAELTADDFEPNLLFDGDRWNLIGNPYPSSIDWGTENSPVTGWTINNIRNTVYVKHGSTFAIWNGAEDGEALNGGSRYIPAMQAFWIKTMGESPTVGMSSLIQTHNGNLLMKVNTSFCQKLRIKVSRDGFTDEALLKFHNNSENSVDKLDAEKMFATSAYHPQLYFKVENEKLAIASFAPFNGVSSHELAFKSDVAGQFTFTFTEMESFGAAAEIYLEDKVANKMVNLNQNPVYAFESGICDTQNRFVIHIADGTTHFNPFEYPGTTGIKALEGNVKVYGHQNSIFVKAEKAMNATVKVYNLLGAEVASVVMNGDFVQIEMPANGQYLIKVLGNGISKIEKVNIK